MRFLLHRNRVDARPPAAGKHRNPCFPRDFEAILVCNGARKCRGRTPRCFPGDSPEPSKQEEGNFMKLTKDTVAKLMLPADKRDVIFFDDEIRGLGYRLRRSPNGQVRASWIRQFRAAGRARRYLIGAGGVSAQAGRVKA